MSKGRFSPYEDNGGTCVGIAGKDFAVLGSDTRQSVGYSINCRTSPKYFKLTNKCVLASAGMNADQNALQRTLEAKLIEYEHQMSKTMSAPAIAQLLSVTLYYRRFFPYYTFNILAGVDEKGAGAVWSYDAVGSFERVEYSASGSGQSLIIPLLDNTVGKKNQTNVLKTDMTLEETVDLLKDAFATAGERDIYTGDYVDILKITKDGVAHEKFQLKFD